MDKCIVSYAEEELGCGSGQPEHCYSENPWPIDFPKNANDLNNICPIALPRLKCLVEYKNKCGLQDPIPMEEKLDEVHSFMVEACNKESELHHELAIRLPCMSKVVENNRNTCHPIVRDTLDEATTRLGIEKDEEGDVANPEDLNKYWCLRESLEYACTVASTSVTCGAETENLVVRIFERIAFLEVTCHGDVKDEVQEMIGLIKVEMKEQIAKRVLPSEIL